MTMLLFKVHGDCSEGGGGGGPSPCVYFSNKMRPVAEKYQY